MNRTIGAVGLALYIGINVALITMLRPDTNHPDWQLWLSLPDKLAAGTLYVQTGETRWVWSPILAPVMAAAPLLGYWTWGALHVAAVFLLRDWRIIALVLLSWGFWIDTIGGNTFAFVFVAGVLALRSSRPAAIVYLGLCILMPRPIQLPLALWLLWSMPSIRLPTLALFAVHALAVLGTGYADEWLASMLRQTGPLAGDIGPTLLFGKAWLIVGIPLAVYLTWKGRLGWAGVAMSPYMLPAYWLMPLLDLVPHVRWLRQGEQGQRRVPDAKVVEGRRRLGSLQR